MVDTAMVGEGEQSIHKMIDDDGDWLAGLELHEDGVEDGDELSLAIEVEADDGPLDGVDHAEGRDVPPERGGGAVAEFVGHGWVAVYRPAPDQGPARRAGKGAMRGAGERSRSAMTGNGSTPC